MPLRRERVMRQSRFKGLLLSTDKFQSRLIESYRQGSLDPGFLTNATLLSRFMLSSIPDA